MRVNVCTTTGNGVLIRISPGDSYDADKSLWFELREISGNAAVASMLRDQIEGQFNAQIKEIRRLAYERGRRSVRDESLRCDDFNPCFNESLVGWKVG